MKLSKDELLEKFAYEFLSRIGEDNLLIDHDFEIVMENEQPSSYSKNFIRISKYKIIENTRTIFELTLFLNSPFTGFHNKTMVSFDFNDFDIPFNIKERSINMKTIDEFAILCSKAYNRMFKGIFLEQINLILSNLNKEINSLSFVLYSSKNTVNIILDVKRLGNFYIEFPLGISNFLSPDDILLQVENIQSNDSGLDIKPVKGLTFSEYIDLVNKKNRFSYARLNDYFDDIELFQEFSSYDPYVDRDEFSELLLNTVENKIGDPDKVFFPYHEINIQRAFNLNDSFFGKETHYQNFLSLMKDKDNKKVFNKKLRELKNNPNMIEKMSPICVSLSPDYLIFRLKSNPFYFYLMAYSGIEYALAIDVENLT